MLTTENHDIHWTVYKRHAIGGQDVDRIKPAAQTGDQVFRQKRSSFPAAGSSLFCVRRGTTGKSTDQTNAQGSQERQDGDRLRKIWDVSVNIALNCMKMRSHQPTIFGRKKTQVCIFLVR